MFLSRGMIFSLQPGGHLSMSGDTSGGYAGGEGATPNKEWSGPKRRSRDPALAVSAECACACARGPLAGKTNLDHRRGVCTPSAPASRRICADNTTVSFVKCGNKEKVP